MGSFSQLKALYETLGLFRFTLFLGAIAAICTGIVAVNTWLAEQIGWPDAYGFHCRGRGCLWIEMAHSYKLLKTAHLYELLLFAWLWLIPVTTLSMVGFVLTRRWVIRYRNRIRPMD